MKFNGLIADTAVRVPHTIVNVSCGQTSEGRERTFTDRRMWIVAVCDEHGVWRPAIPDCTGTQRQNIRDSGTGGGGDGDTLEL